jgi:hypothetical protein
MGYCCKSIHATDTESFRYMSCSNWTRWYPGRKPPVGLTACSEDPTRSFITVGHPWIQDLGGLVRVWVRVEVWELWEVKWRNEGMGGRRWVVTNRPRKKKDCSRKGRMSVAVHAGRSHVGRVPSNVLFVFSEVCSEIIFLCRMWTDISSVFVLRLLYRIFFQSIPCSCGFDPLFSLKGS